MFCEVYLQNLLFKKINPSSFPALNKNTLAGIFEAGGEGVEPPHTDSESAVLPLDEPPKGCWYSTRCFSHLQEQFYAAGSFLSVRMWMFSTSPIPSSKVTNELPP